ASAVYPPVSGHPPDNGAQEISLSAELTDAIRGFARRHDLTPNTIVQGALSLLLSRYTGKDDVVFGAARAGRKCGLEGADSIVGLLLNALPIRVRIPGGVRVLPWLESLRAVNVELRPHEHAPLVSIQGWSQAGPGASLFDTILVFANSEFDDLLHSLG